MSTRFPAALVPYGSDLTPESEDAARGRYRGFGDDLFERLYEAMPALDGALHFFRDARGCVEDVWCYAEVDGTLLGLQLDPDIEVICVWDAEHAIEIGTWHADPTAVAIAAIRAILARADAG